MGISMPQGHLHATVPASCRHTKPAFCTYRRAGSPCLRGWTTGQPWRLVVELFVGKTLSCFQTTSIRDVSLYAQPEPVVRKPPCVQVDPNYRGSCDMEWLVGMVDLVL